ncbi:xylanase inhibitor protein 1-like [Oryza brachyantha]|uniref:xylanase inhibitor protein 1-like n=1 Tax=Oryza brachyantha TaxID=4533 RepID=UPI001AD9BEB6|nr:xylanase inhibitor protein 1-like [Oryza brachyantha]
MAVTGKRQASVSLLALAALLAVFAGHAAAAGKTGQVTVFWGRNKAEGSLREACDAGTYTLVVISFLDVFGGHGTPGLDLSGHPVAGVGDDIKHCQSKSIMVFLSIGGFGSQYSLPSAKAATDLADYLWYAYLAGSGNGTGVRRPFGDAYVDGVDLFIDQGPPDFYDVLAARLWSYNKQFRARTPVQLSATPRCRYPDRRVERALATGVVTRINVRLYGDGYCAAYWQQEWEKWTAAYPDSGIYVGLPASEQTVGYVHPKNLYYGVVPVVQKAANYGGVMIWDRYADKRSNYSGYAIQWA